MRLTTILLFVLLLLTVIKASAQISITSEDLKPDTTKVKLLVSIDELDFDKGSAYTMDGYEVMEIKSDTIIWFYLDKNKKPLQKGINVWMSKPVKP